MTKLLLAAAALIGFAAYSLLGERNHINPISPVLFFMCLYNLALAPFQLRTTGLLASKASRLPGWTRIPKAWRISGPEHLVLPHLAAIVLAAGAVIGMYWDGLFRQYTAQWESTWLSPWTMNVLTHIFFGIPSFLTGLGIPDAALLEKPSSGPGAPWVHLHAAAALIYIAVPRAVLTAITYLRFIRKFPGVTHAAILPFQHDLPGTAMDQLETAFRQVAGAHATLREPIPYGEAAPGIPKSQCAVLIFALTDTPEPEIHGRLAKQAKANAGRRAAVVALVDQSSYPHGESQQKKQETLWDNVLNKTGIPAIHVNLATISASELAMLLRTKAQMKT